MELGILFFVLGLPLILYAALRGYQMYMAQQQYQAIIAERRLLLERGVPADQLPPLQVPETHVISGQAKSAPVREMPRRETIVEPRNPVARIVLSLLVIILGFFMFVVGQMNSFDGLYQTLGLFGALILLAGITMLIVFLVKLGRGRRVQVEYVTQPCYPPAEQTAVPAQSERAVPLSPPRVTWWRASGDPFGYMKAAFFVLGIAGGMAAMALWGNWNNNATPQQILLNFALFPTALGIAFLVLQLFLSITDHRLALIKGVVYLVLVAIGCWALPSLYQPQLPWVQQVQRLGIVPIGIAVALFADYLLGRWLEKSKPLQQESCEETVVLSKRG